MKMIDILKENLDIVITLPSNIEWNEYQKELKNVEDGDQVLNFKVSNLPKRTSIGNKCYLCYRGNVIGWMEIVGLVKNDFKCTTTGKEWNGNFIQRSGIFHKLEKPIPMGGFQGFRYLNNSKNGKKL